MIVVSLLPRTNPVVAASVSPEVVSVAAAAVLSATSVARLATLPANVPLGESAGDIMPPVLQAVGKPVIPVVAMVLIVSNSPIHSLYSKNHPNIHVRSLESRLHPRPEVLQLWPDWPSLPRVPK